MNNDDRMEVKFLGLLLGTADGWDDVDGGRVAFYDFTPTNKFSNFHPCPVLIVDCVNGKLFFENDNGDNILTLTAQVSFVQ